MADIPPNQTTKGQAADLCPETMTWVDICKQAKDITSRLDHGTTVFTSGEIMVVHEYWKGFEMMGIPQEPPTVRFMNTPGAKRHIRTMLRDRGLSRLPFSIDIPSNDSVERKPFDWKPLAWKKDLIIPALAKALPTPATPKAPYPETCEKQDIDTVFSGHQNNSSQTESKKVYQDTPKASEQTPSCPMSIWATLPSDEVKTPASVSSNLSTTRRHASPHQLTGTIPIGLSTFPAAQTPATLLFNTANTPTAPLIQSADLVKVRVNGKEQIVSIQAVIGCNSFLQSTIRSLNETNSTLESLLRTKNERIEALDKHIASQDSQILHLTTQIGQLQAKLPGRRPAA
ncbi:hypothetical protein N7462_011520 [Penicillium macrosclerotiorum]|uniref:uncharacterized protein n=1 Tax=Penicillium macrosclerotiorum TaxID=303699 RepID=UPI002549AD0E|nr:uncharacterized protein N7462_011520 [Penicillium macrosclerotiorum]KAJ5664707.1 hypothetical protein N7462_011520 [Penicillium macrosclerotiorum]